MQSWKISRDIAVGCKPWLSVPFLSIIFAPSPLSTLSSLLIFFFHLWKKTALFSSLLLLSCNFPRHGEGSGSGGGGSYVQVFPMQPHRRGFVPPLGFGGPHSRAVPHSTDSTMGLYAAKASLPHITPSSLPPQGHRDSQRALRHQNAKTFNAQSSPALSRIEWEGFPE